MNRLDLKIGEMNCEKCADRLQTLLQKTTGIRQASVSFETGKGEVSFRPQTLDENRIIAVIERAGFSVERE